MSAADNRTRTSYRVQLAVSFDATATADTHAELVGLVDGFASSPEGAQAATAAGVAFAAYCRRKTAELDRGGAR